MEETKPSKENKPSIVSEAVLLAILTAGAYWIAFTHEAGYLKVFQVPLNIIQIKVETILFVLFLLISGLVTILWLTNLLALLWPKHPTIRLKS